MTAYLGPSKGPAKTGPYLGPSSSKSSSSAYTGSSKSPPPKKQHGGGSVWDHISHAAGSVAHVAAKTGEGLASDAKNFPGGIYQAGKGVGTDTEALIAKGSKAVGLKPSGLDAAALKSDPSGYANIFALAKAQLKSMEETAQHPLRHPDQSLLNVAAVASLGAGTFARVAEAGKAASFSDALKALATKVPEKPRLLRVGDMQRSLHPSRNSLVRGVQGLHDKVVQHAIDNNPEGHIGSYGTKRIGGSLEETRRMQHHIQATPANILDSVGRKLKGDKVAKQRALRLTSENRTPDEEIALHQSQLEKGVNPAGQKKQIDILQRVKNLGLVKQDEHGHVVIDATKHPDLAAIDARLAAGARERETILEDTGQMTREAMQARSDRPNIVTATGERVSEDAIKHGAQGQLSMLEPETRPGRNYVPYYGSEARASKSALGATPAPVIGKTKGLISKTQHFEGENLLSGKTPDNTTRLVSEQMKRAYRFANSDRFRRDIVKSGSDTRKTSRDVLVNTQELKNAKVPEDVKQILGTRVSTLDELDDHTVAYDNWRQKILPHLHKAGQAEENKFGIGAKAPEGFRWVDKNLLGSLAKPIKIGDKSRIARATDTINSAVTAATVYFKPGHIATRSFTNAFTNIVQGSATPVGIGKTVSLWHDLGNADRVRALSAAGLGGIGAMPAEALNSVGRTARAGALWWSKHVDAPFRFNSLAYEARKAGIKTSADFTKMLDQMENHDGMTPEEIAKVEGIAKRADRESIAYDRLNETERNYMNRVFWFYPWIKGATMFAGNTLLEHPYKADLLGQVGAQGTAQAKKDFGLLPSYEQGLFKIGGSTGLPLTINPATIQPFGTPADVAEAFMHANKPTQSEQLAQWLTPLLGAAGGAAFHLNSFGGASTKGVLPQLLASLQSSTPEAALYAALFGHPSAGTKSRKMFPPDKEQALLKFLLGSETPRVMNRNAANTAALKELKAAGRKPTP